MTKVLAAAHQRGVTTVLTDDGRQWKKSEGGRWQEVGEGVPCKPEKHDELEGALDELEGALQRFADDRRNSYHYDDRPTVPCSHADARRVGTAEWCGSCGAVRTQEKWTLPERR